MKTIAAKLLCNQLDLPIIIVPGYVGGMIEFISSLEFECVILLDEAEKMFNSENPEASQALLKVIDGVMNKSRKLYILTTNTLNLNENLLGRPGRIRYIKQFKNISIECINAYLDDNLNDKSNRKDIIELIDSLEVSTIDTLRSIVDEVNIHGGLTDMSEFNLTFRNNYCSSIGVYIPAEDLGNEDEEKNFEDLKKFVARYKTGSVDSWWYGKFDERIDPEFVREHFNDNREDDDEDEVESYEVSLSNSPLKATLGSGVGKKKVEEENPVREYNINMDDYLEEKFDASNYNLSYRGTRISEGLVIDHYGVVVKNLGDGWWAVDQYGRGEYRLFIEKPKNRFGAYRGGLY